jgi:hypothetical protein
MRYIPEDAAQLRVCLEGQPDDRKVEADPNTGIDAKTVKDLRALEAWPPGLVVDTPRENYPELTVKDQVKTAPAVTHRGSGRVPPRTPMSGVPMRAGRNVFVHIR